MSLRDMVRLPTIADRNAAGWTTMTLFDFRASRGVRPEALQRALGGDYVEFDEILASASAVALEEDAGYLVLIEDDEFGWAATAPCARRRDPSRRTPRTWSRFRPGAEC